MNRDKEIQDKIDQLRTKIVNQEQILEIDTINSMISDLNDIEEILHPLSDVVECGTTFEEREQRRDINPENIGDQ